MIFFSKRNKATTNSPMINVNNAEASIQPINNNIRKIEFLTLLLSSQMGIKSNVVKDTFIATKLPIPGLKVVPTKKSPASFPPLKGLMY